MTREERNRLNDRVYCRVVVAEYGPTRWMGDRAWRHPQVVRGALCPDGKRRSVTLGQAADTYFSWPGRASINGRTVSGFVTTGASGCYAEDTHFTPNREG
jgi:hypothetical protein